MFPGTAKTDAIDAEVIARTALGVPRALRPAPEEPEGTASLRILSSQREFASSARTRAKNRLRATLLDVSVNLFFTSFAKQARRSRKGGFTGCANVFSPIPVTA